MGICDGCVRKNSEEPKPVLSSNKIKQISGQTKDCICEILGTEGGKGTAFFCKIPFDEETKIPVMITTNSILNQNDIANGKTIKIGLNNIHKKIHINHGRKTYTNEIYDVTIIEIFAEKDGIENFLELDYSLEETNFDQKYVDKEIYILQHPENGLPSYSTGVIKGINNFDIDHCCLVEKGTSGGPIVSLETNKVLGILKEGIINEYNKGTILKFPINEFNKICKKNEITLVLEIKDKIDLNSDIYFVDNSEGKYECGEVHSHDNLKELNEQNTTLFINDVQQNFQKFFKPTEKGKYEIKLVFDFALKDCSFMFGNCTKITKIDFSKFNTKNITSMKYMFYKCNNIQKLELSNFVTKNVTDMKYAFAYCEKLATLNFKFDTENTTDMAGMFMGCDALSEINLSTFKTEKVTNMKSMFEHCINVKTIDINHFDTKNVTDMASMFRDCSNLSKIIVESLDISNVVNLEYIFSCCYNLMEFNLNIFKNCEKVANLGSMFYSCNNISSLDFSNFSTKSITNMGAMFYDCKKLANINLSGVNTENVTNMGAMFYNCSKLEKLDFSGFNTQNVTNMGAMFYDCYNLEKLDLSSFNTANVTNMASMFELCENLTEIILSSFDTSNVKNMKSMFSYCEGLTKLDLSNFKTENVTNMSNMFDHCSNAESIIVSKFNTKNCKDMKNLFNNCSALTELNLLSFTIEEDSKINNIFKECSNLKTLRINRSSYNFIKDQVEKTVKVSHR